MARFQNSNRIASQNMRQTRAAEMRHRSKPPAVTQSLFERLGYDHAMI